MRRASKCVRSGQREHYSELSPSDVTDRSFFDNVPAVRGAASAVLQSTRASAGPRFDYHGKTTMQLTALGAVLITFGR